MISLSFAIFDSIVSKVICYSARLMVKNYNTEAQWLPTFDFFFFFSLFILTFVGRLLLTSWKLTKAVPRVRQVCYNLNLRCVQQV